MPKPSSIRRSVRHRASSVSDVSGDHAAFINSVIAAAGGVVYETPNIENPSGVHALTSADFDTVLNRATWYGGHAFIKHLNSIAYQGFTDWRLPTTNPDVAFSAGYPDGLEGNPPMSSSEMATLFYGQLGQVRGQYLSVVHNDNYYLFRNINDFAHWSGTELGGRPEMAWFFNAYSGWQYEFGIQSGHFKNQAYSLLPVRTGIAIPLPEKLLADLKAAVVGVGAGKSLVNKVALAETYYAVPDIQATCAVLDDFQKAAAALRGKKIAGEVAGDLIVDAEAVQSAVGCN
jgi:hypothetical protein